MAPNSLMSMRLTEGITPRVPVKVHVDMGDILKMNEEFYRMDAIKPRMPDVSGIIAHVVKDLYTFALENKRWTVYEVKYEETERDEVNGNHIAFNTYYKFFCDKNQARKWAEGIGGIFLEHRLKRFATMTDGEFKAFLIAYNSGGNDELITRWREAVKEKIKK